MNEEMLHDEMLQIIQLLRRIAEALEKTAGIEHLEHRDT